MSEICVNIEENAPQLPSGKYSDMTSTDTETGSKRARETKRRQIDKWKRVVLEEDSEIENANSEKEYETLQKHH